MLFEVPPAGRADGPGVVGHGTAGPTELGRRGVVLRGTSREAAGPGAHPKARTTVADGRSPQAYSGRAGTPVLKGPAYLKSSRVNVAGLAAPWKVVACPSPTFVSDFRLLPTFVFWGSGSVPELPRTPSELPELSELLLKSRKSLMACNQRPS